MRITNNMMMNRYKRNLNNTLRQMNETSNQIATGRRFMRGSEDPVRALKALQVRRRGDALEQFHFNIEAAEVWVKDTETVISAIKNSADRAYDAFLQGRNDPLAVEDRQIIATTLRSIQDQILKDLNSQLAGKYLLGAANTKHIPFIVDDTTGHLWFNVAPSEIMRDPETGKTQIEAEHGVTGWNVFMMGQDGYDYFDEQPVYWDLTGDFQMDLGSEEFINPNALFDVRTTGLDIIGTGPDNLYNLIGRLALAFEMEDMQTIDGPIDTEMFIAAREIGPDGEEFWPFEDFLIGRYPDLTQPNPDYPHTTVVNEGEADEARIIRPEMPGHRPYLATTMTMYLEDDYSYLRAYEGAKGLAERLQEAQLNCIIELTRVGEKANYVDFLKIRNENNMDMMYEMQNKLEAMPPDEAILRFKMEDYVYKACLQMGNYIFQPSLMNFLGR